MSQKNRKPGKPKGLPKSGGRQIGTPNKANIRMRARFEEQGFDFAFEFTKAFRKLKTSSSKIEVLIKMAPFFMQRLREDSEEIPASPGSSQPQEDLDGVPTDRLMQLLRTTVNPGGGH